MVLEGEAKKVRPSRGRRPGAYSLSVYAKPNAIPNELTVDVSDLAIGEAIKVADIVLPEGVRTEVDPDEVVVTGVGHPRTLEARSRGAEAVEGEAADEGEGCRGRRGEGDGRGRRRHPEPAR
jgi:large subunit ribosomal protein L25